MIIPLKKKHRPQPFHDGDIWAKKQHSTSNHSGKKRIKLHGPETYDIKQHILVITPKGKRVWIHNGDES